MIRKEVQDSHEEKSLVMMMMIDDDDDEGLSSGVRNN